MDPYISNKQAKELLDALTHIWNHALSFLNSMALKCAIQLGIPDAIQKHGKAMTLDELANSLSVHPNKAPALRQVMRLLVHSNFFTNNLDNGQEVFDLTLCSQLLLKDHPFTQAPFTLLETDPSLTEPSHNFGLWFRNEDDYESPFHMAHGKNIYERMPSVSVFNELFNRTMSHDSRFVSSFLGTSDVFKGLVEGLDSLVDVGGGDGTMAKAIAEAYPKIKCIVYDLPHVVDGLQGNGRNLTYVAGNMFEGIPRAQAVLLKWAFHNWSDDHCIKALQRCKEAIPSKEKGGKVMLIEMVMGIPNDNVNHSLSQFLMDIQMLLVSKGKERTEEQWKYLFDSAGFSDYKILPILGSRSIIEVYPA